MNNDKLKILIIDDDEIVRETYADVFRQEKFEVEEAVDGVDGLDKATTFVPDAILTGIIMPRMDGFGLKDALGKNVATANIPVFMLSHMGREEDKKKAQDLGIKDFIIKGMISPRQVVEKIRAIFGTSEYKIKLSANDLDGIKLVSDFHLGSGFACPRCQKEMIMILKISDVVKREFTARLVCPDCG